jgi:large subunit ribosomal protein L18
MSLRTVKRRRLECKTDYKLRFGLLKSPLPRIVVRRTNKYFIVQVVTSSEAQDTVTLGLTSKELLNYGWDAKFAGSLKSIPAGYLTGYLIAKKLGKGKYISDFGMAINKQAGRTSSVIAGLVDGGLDISVGEKFLPKEDVLSGIYAKDGVKEMIEKTKTKIDSGAKTASKEKPAKKTKESKK